MPIEVKFRYDEPSKKWKIFIAGCSSEREAKQAFNAVLLTIKQSGAIITLQHRVQLADAGEYELEVAVGP